MSELNEAQLIKRAKFNREKAKSFYVKIIMHLHLRFIN